MSLAFSGQLIEWPRQNDDDEQSAAQGDDAPGGAQSYMVNGKMTSGFAILATPVKYAETGIMTFITGRDGVVSAAAK